MKLEEVKGVGPSTLRKLQSIDVSTVEDLINFLPKTYIDFNSPVSLNDLCDGQFSLIRVRIVKVTRPVKTKNGLSFFTADAVDFDAPETDKNRLKIVWYNQPYMLQKVKADEKYFVFGKVKFSGRRAELINPKIEPLDKQKNLSGIMPVYRTKGAVQQGVFKGIIDDALRKFSPADIANEKVRERYGIESVKDAFIRAHCPTSVEEGLKAQERIALEDTMKEILYYKIINSQAKENRVFEYRLDKRVVDDFVKSLPFPLTPTQKNALDEIFENLKSKRRMNRLLIGDVGSGKTIVALISALYAVKCGYQVAIVAPTEILAEQHYLKFRQMLDKLDVPVSLVTADRKEESHVSFGKQGGIVVGTHALLYGKNVPERVGLVVIDEQHKFGVNQREKLIDREERPDVLVMTATPIPRTLTLTFYGELDVSILDGVPGGRGAVVTAIRTEKDKGKVLAFVRNQLEEGRQIYVVSPLIDGEDSRKGKAVTKEWDEWKALLPHVDVGLLHGRMSSEEKEAVMKDFRSNRISVLVSTTVVEVGVDVPYDTLMIINNAESFGLSQLHQLRGRIGRGSHKSYCILMTDARPEDEQWEKLRIVETTANGFDLAEQDLRLRGPGDVLGTSQSGLKGVRFEEWLLDARLIHRGRQLAEAILAEDPNLESAKYCPLRFLLEDGAGRRVAG